MIGLPWTVFLVSLGKLDALSGVTPAVLTILAPAINLAILFSICSTFDLLDLAQTSNALQRLIGGRCLLNGVRQQGRKKARSGLIAP